MKIKSTDEIKKLQKNIVDENSRIKQQIIICGGTGCLANGSKEIADLMKDMLKKEGINIEVELNVKLTGCHGFCERGPIIVFQPEEIFYQQVKLSDIPKIIEETVKNGRIVERLLYKNPKTKSRSKSIVISSFTIKQNV